MEYVHYSVMKDEVLQYLVPPADRPAQMVDCTCGEGGHTYLFLSKYPNLHVTGLDRDSGIQEKAINRMAEFKDMFTPVNTWFD
jgi:16S rRNA (cytosine1402-N4)-methyltransferase